MEKASRFPGAGDPMSLLSLCGSPEARLSRAPLALTPAWPWGSGRPAWAHSRRMVSSVTQLAWHAVPCSARSPRQAGAACGEPMLVPAMGDRGPLGGFFLLLSPVWRTVCPDGQATPPSPGQWGAAGPLTRVLDLPTEAALGPDPGGLASLLHFFTPVSRLGNGRATGISTGQQVDLPGLGALTRAWPSGQSRG